MTAGATSSAVLSSTARVFPMRRRPDLEIYHRGFQGRPCWVIKDPVGVQYFRFEEEEYALFAMLDGQHSLEEIQEEFEERFRPRSIRTEEIQRFAAMLHQAGLVLSDAPGQGVQLYHQAQERKRRRLLAGVSNLLAIRFRGINPDAFLERILPYMGWLFSRAAIGVGVALILAALGSVLVHFDLFLARLPQFHEFFALGNLPPLMVVLAGMKVLHELGHALVCKRLGGACTEMGLMLLVFTPCLYCNVSDAWVWKSKWHRMAVAGAGIYVELLLAALATWVWWWTEPGLIHQLALAVMLLGSVNTVFLNGNPLLRYDGYYVLADLLEVPNLQQKASALLQRTASRWLLGLAAPEDPFLPQKYWGWFVLYAVAAFVYRWLVLAGILWFLYKALEPARVQVVGQALAAATLLGLVGWPGYRIYRFFTTPTATRRISRIRSIFTLTGLGIVILASLAIPLPHYITCPVEIRPADAAAVYVEVPGRLASVAVQPGQSVRAGQLLAELQNPDAELDIARLETLRDECHLRWQNARWQQHRDPAATAELRQLEESLRAVEEQLAKRREDVARLRLVAPTTGMVFAPPWTPTQDSPEGRLPTWTGTPMESENLGAWLHPGTLFCLVGDPAQMEALLVMDQADVKWVQEGQPVKIFLHAYPDRPITSRQQQGQRVALEIVEVSRSEVQRVPLGLSTKAGGDVPTEKDALGHQRPARPSYQARVLVDNPEGFLRPGLRGLARIRTENLTLAGRLWRLVCQTFRVQ